MHFDNYYDLRERVAMTMAQFDRLFPGPLRSGRTLIIDRAIFGHRSFQMFRDRGDHLITWEKGYAGGAWCNERVMQEFALLRVRNHSTDLLTYRFLCQESAWDKDPAIRRIIVRTSNPEGRQIEVSVLCTNPLMTIREIVELIFNRWIQENDFRYLDRHFGIMQITAYASDAYTDIAAKLKDQTVEGPAFRNFRNQHRKLEHLLEKQLFAREKLQDRLASATPPLRNRHRLNHRLNELQQLIAKNKDALAALDLKIDTVLRDESRLARLIRENYCRLDTRCKATMDALKITARNIFQLLLVEFRQFYDNRRDDHAILRLLSTSSGVIRETDGVTHIGLWLRGNFPPAIQRACSAFLDHLSAAINRQFAGRASHVVVQLLDGAPTL